jgi:ketosteroid isomerase-like protein
MLRACLLLVLSIGPIASLLVAQDSAAARVLAAEDQRFAAMMRGDTAAVRARLADDLAYTHTTGARQDKAEFLRSLSTGQLRYRSIVPTERSVRILGAEGAVVVGRSNMQVESGGQVLVFVIRYLAVYRRVAGEWQLVAWQSTRLPD